MPESQSPNATTGTKIVREQKNRREEKEKEGCDRWKGFESVFGESEKNKFPCFAIREEGGGVCVRRSKEGVILCAAGSW